MSTEAGDSWDSVRQTFADQFEQDGTNYVYRRSQKGEALRVSAEERSKFIGEFDQNIRRAKWILYAGITLVIGGLILFSLFRSTNLSEVAIFIGIGVAVIPYFAFYRWAWAAPARDLGGRTPIAGERPSDEVRRIRFQGITYGQLAGAAFGGVIIPFIGSSGADVFSGWHRLWLLFGGALVLLAAVQAFRKWRLEQESSGTDVIPISTSLDEPQLAQEPEPGVASKLWRYLPFAALILGLAFIAYTSAGKQLAKQPSFWPILMIGCGSWSLITVTRGYSKGQIQPFARGFYNTYARETQPKRFWASMGWNATFGCFCLWISLMMIRDAGAQRLQDRCYNEGRKYQPGDVLLACTELISRKGPSDDWSQADVLVNRGAAYARIGRPRDAIADYTTAVSLQPRFPEAYYNRGLAYEQVGVPSRALADYSKAIQQNPRNARFFSHRGVIYVNMRRWDAAIDDFSRAHELDPKNAWPLASRGLAYALKSDPAHAKQDFATARGIDPQNPVLLRGEGLVNIWDGDLEAAVDQFSAAIRIDPSDAWSLRMRADAYQQMGDFENARRDREELERFYQASRQRSAPRA